MFFFFFMKNLEDEPIIHEAFKIICFDKMLIDGYCNMNKYITGEIDKNEMLAKLKKENSFYAALYMEPYPSSQEELKSKWMHLLPNDNKNSLSILEADAIVNWIYQALKTNEERKEFTKLIFKNIKNLHSIANYIEFKEGVAYNSQKVQLEFISSISDFYSLSKTLTLDKEKLFYRGHSNANYLLIPSVFRTALLRTNE